MQADPVWVRGALKQMPIASEVARNDIQMLGWKAKGRRTSVCISDANLNTTIRQTRLVEQKIRLRVG